MNYLAHAYLSFGNPDILAGNMISDFVKGKRKFDYPLPIQQGIQLHRLIDNFTDFHPVTAKAKTLFRPQYRLYSGAFIDVVYDHFLALDADKFESGLKNFSEETYYLLEKNSTFFPRPFLRMFPYMQTQNWLYDYRLKEGIAKAFNGLVYRAKYLQESAIAFELFNKNYDELREYYLEFFPDLKEYTLTMLSNLTPP